jgi:hypothetical protein
MIHDGEDTGVLGRCRRIALVLGSALTKPRGLEPASYGLRSECS